MAAFLHGPLCHAPPLAFNPLYGAFHVFNPLCSSRVPGGKAISIQWRDRSVAAKQGVVAVTLLSTSCAES